MVDTGDLPPSVIEAIKLQKKKDIEEGRETTVVVKTTRPLRRGGGRSTIISGTTRTIQQIRAKADKVAAEAITQQVIKERVAAREEAVRKAVQRKREETAAERALALAVAQREVSASTRFAALRARRLAEQKQKIEDPTQAEVLLGGGIVRATGIITPFAPDISPRPPPPKEVKPIPTGEIRAAPKRKEGLAAFFAVPIEAGEEIATRAGKPTPGAFIARKVRAGIEEVVIPIKQEFQQFQLSRITVPREGEGIPQFFGAVSGVGEQVGEQLPITREILGVGLVVGTAAIFAPSITAVVFKPLVVFAGLEVFKTAITGEPPTPGRAIETAAQVAFFELAGKGTREVLKIPARVKQARFERRIRLTREQVGEPFVREKAIFQVKTTQFSERAISSLRRRSEPLGRRQFIELEKVQPGLTVIEKRTGAVLSERQLQLTRKPFDVLAEFKRPAVGVGRIEPPSDFIGKFFRRPVPLDVRPTFIRATIGGKPVVRVGIGTKFEFIRPETQVTLTKFKPVVGRITSQRQITFQQPPTPKPPTLLQRVFQSRFLKSKKSQVALTTQIEIEPTLVTQPSFEIFETVPSLQLRPELQVKPITSTITPTIKTTPIDITAIVQAVGTVGAAAALRREQLPIQRLDQLQRVIPKQVQVQDIIIEHQFIPPQPVITTPISISSIAQEITPKQRITPVLIPPVVEVPVTIPVPPDMDIVPRPRPPQLELVPEPRLIDIKLGIEEPGQVIGKQRGFNAFVKEKGKNVKLNTEPLPRNAALNLALNTADQTPSVTAKIKPSKKPTRIRFDDFLDQQLLNKFEIRKDREGEGNIFVEKNEFRIDSPGEIRGIPVKGHQAIRARAFAGFI